MIVEIIYLFHKSKMATYIFVVQFIYFYYRNLNKTRYHTWQYFFIEVLSDS